MNNFTFGCFERSIDGTEWQVTDRGGTHRQKKTDQEFPGLEDRVSSWQKGTWGAFFLKAPNLDLIVGGESLNASEVKNIWSSDGEAEESK